MHLFNGACENIRFSKERLDGFSGECSHLSSQDVNVVVGPTRHHQRVLVSLLQFSKNLSTLIRLYSAVILANEGGLKVFFEEDDEDKHVGFERAAIRLIFVPTEGYYFFACSACRP